MLNHSSTSTSQGLVVIVGFGPNLGLSIARKFAHEGYSIAILARDFDKLGRYAEEIATEENGRVYAISVDCSSMRSIMEAFQAVHSIGSVDVLIYNASTQYCQQPTRFMDIPVRSFAKSMTVSSTGAFYCSQKVIRGMMARGRGTILFTGCSASLGTVAGFSDLCCGKFALRALSQCLAREVQPLGIHVAHIIIDGVIGPSSRERNPTTSQTAAARGGAAAGGGAAAARAAAARAAAAAAASPSSSSSSASSQVQQSRRGDVTMDPDVLAQTFWQLHVQDRTAWTQEIDLRPSNPLCFS